MNVVSPHTLAVMQNPSTSKQAVDERKKSVESIQLSLNENETPATQPVRVPASDFRLDQEQTVKAVVAQDEHQNEESFREKLNIKQLTFAKNDSDGSILEIKKFGKPAIKGHATASNITGKKKGRKIKNATATSPFH